MRAKWTDLAVEAAGGELREGGLSRTVVKVEDEASARRLGRPMGTYVTLACEQALTVSLETRRALAAELAGRYPEAAARPAAVGCDLGETGEYVKIATLGELAEDAAAARPLSVLALLPGPQRPELPLGLPDEDYRHLK